ncbi:MAG TPA: 4-aminobutyrate--2-oxoglutarate transaminase [Actinomycetota bacterium]|jgi:4-aminobutyrate aminotransferase/(S)-3-amino-2-methylpropionate transaminase|nr:4-aminobutyrate--2-oxoglutarate transaminase [Actinomycetota bacterium]
MDIPQERKLVTEIPGPKSREWFARREQAVATGVYNIHPIVTARASGAIVEDVDGNRLIDFATGISVLNVGHSSPAVVAAAQRQVELDTHTCFHVTANEPYIELAERLNALAPGEFPKKTMFANSGAEAVENAVKIARKATGRAAVVAFDHAFHGRTLMGMSLTAKVMPYKQGMGPFAPEIYRLPFAYPYRCPTAGTPQTCGDSCADYAIDEMHKHIGEQNVAAVILEPIQGEGGFIVPASGFVKRIADFCAANGIVFIADEIQSGIGRAGRWFAIEDEDVVPDIVTTAKSLGGGLPISGITGRAELMDAVHPGGLGGTYGGNPVAAAAALAVVDLIEREGLLERSRALGERIMARFREMQARHDVIGDVRGRGAMCAIELVSDRATKEPADEATSAVAKRCLENGLIVLSAGTYNNVLRLLPPLTIEDALLDEGLGIVDEAVRAVAR